MRTLKSRKSQFNFTWLFAIIAGGAILVLAIYAAVNIGKTQRFGKETELAKELSILFDPMQAGFAEGKDGFIIFRDKVKIRNICYSDDFGRNKISVDEGAYPEIPNKYIFSSSSEQGEEFYVISMPFNFPYKVSDMLFLISEKHCFIEPPQYIEDELYGLRAGLEKEYIEIDNCSSESIKICFNYGSDCDITVYGTCMYDCDNIFEEGYVENYGERFDYTGNLMYAAIFSDKGIYECNIKRLLYRTSKIAGIYAEKADLMNARACNTNLKPHLVLFSSQTLNADSSDLISLNQVAKDIDKINNKELCGIW